MRLLRTFLGCVGFCAAVSISFFIINDVEYEYTHYSNVPININTYTSGIISDVDADYSLRYVPTLLPPYTPYALLVAASPSPTSQPIRRPPVTESPTPRFVKREAVEYIQLQGYAYSMFVQFADKRLSFHIAQDANMEYALLTIDTIVEVFDKAYALFPGWPFLDYYIVTGLSDAENRQINYNFAHEPTRGFITTMYFNQSLRYTLPKWLSSGLDDYLQTRSDSNLMTEAELVNTLQTQTAPFGDAWYISSMRPNGVSAYSMCDISYTIITRWSQAGTLSDKVALAQDDTHAFGISAYTYILGLIGRQAYLPLQILYQEGDILVITQQGEYIFVCNNHDWTWERVSSFIRYMDASLAFVRDHFLIQSDERVSITLYPYSVIDIPCSIADMADVFGWDAEDVNFATAEEIILASTLRFGTWATAHEAVHLFLFREFPWYQTPTWIVEGIAVLGELLFRESFDGARTYRFRVPMVNTIDDLSRNRSGHYLPLHYNEENFGRSNLWTYDDVGSLFLYLYNRFDIEPLLDFYRTDNNTQFEQALELFGYSLEELIYSWRTFLWPNGEPEGWW